MSKYCIICGNPFLGIAHPECAEQFDCSTCTNYGDYMKCAKCVVSKVNNSGK